jgi:hypothetical protein
MERFGDAHALPAPRLPGALIEKEHIIAEMLKNLMASDASHTTAGGAAMTTAGAICDKALPLCL